MKVEINTEDKSVYVSATDYVKRVEELDEMIKLLRVARRWLKQARPTVNAKVAAINPAPQSSKKLA